MNDLKELRRIVKYISALLHESHYPHLHRQLSRDDLLQLNKLRKMFFDKVATNKDLIYKIREDPSVFMCIEVIKFLNEGELPTRFYEELFKIIEMIYENNQFENLSVIREDLKKLDSEKVIELLKYWKSRDERFFHVLEIFVDYDNLNKIIDHIESLKRADKEYLKLFLSKLDKELLKRISGAYE
ncbi:MAG: hypothetical protein QXL02_01920 [Candidatus Anstonellales archaeon]